MASTMTASSAPTDNLINGMKIMSLDYVSTCKEIFLS